MKPDTLAEIDEALKEYEEGVKNSLTRHAYRTFVLAAEEATIDANRAGIPNEDGTRPDYKTKVDPKQWMVIDAGAMSYIAQYRQLLVEEGATMINGQKIPWLRDFEMATRSDVVNVIEEGIAEGLRSKDEVARRLRPILEGSKHKAETVARTETSAIRANAKTARWKDRGYQVVRITDGRGSNPCDICKAIDGQFWTVEYYSTHHLEHPNCTRNASPVMWEDVPPGEFVWGLGNVPVPKVSP